MLPVVTGRCIVLRGPVGDGRIKRLGHVLFLESTNRFCPGTESAFPVARFTLWLPEEFDRVDIEHVSELLEHVDGCGFLAFEHPDVVAVDAGPGREFLL